MYVMSLYAKSEDLPWEDIVAAQSVKTEAALPAPVSLVTNTGMCAS